MKKKLVATITVLALALALCFTLVACGDGNKGDGKGNGGGGIKLSETMTEQELRNVFNNAESATLTSKAIEKGKDEEGKPYEYSNSMTMKFTKNALLVSYGNSEYRHTMYLVISGDKQYTYESALKAGEVEKSATKSLSKYSSINSSDNTVYLTDIVDMIEKSGKNWKVKSEALGEGMTGSVSFSDGKLSIKIVQKYAGGEVTSEDIISDINSTKITKPSEFDGMKESDAEWDLDVVYNNAQYQMNEAKTGYEVVQNYSSDRETVTSINIESTINTLPVVGIDSWAFQDHSGLTSIVIPDSVTEIGSSAFSGCSGLTSITIPVGVTNIGSNVFSGCDNLTTINCKVTEQPSGWSNDWNDGCSATVVWGYKG